MCHSTLETTEAAVMTAGVEGGCFGGDHDGVEGGCFGGGGGGGD